MKRQRFEKLVRALSIRIAEKHGYKVTGEMLKKQKDLGVRKCLEDHGSYQAAWDWMKPVRDAYGMD